MENLISLRFEKKVFDEMEDFVFKGIRCSQDEVYKLCVILGELLGSDVFLELEDKEFVSSFMFKKEDVLEYDKYSLDGDDDSTPFPVVKSKEEFLGEDYFVEDEEIQDDNIGD